MPRNPYIVIGEITLTSGGQGTFSYQTNRGERLEIHGWRFNSDGIFNITDIRNSQGDNFTNASSAEPLLSSLLPSDDDDFHALSEFSEPLIVENGDTFYIDLVDTSVAANIVTVALMTMREFRQI